MSDLMIWHGIQVASYLAQHSSQLYGIKLIVSYAHRAIYQHFFLILTNLLKGQLASSQIQPLLSSENSEISDCCPASRLNTKSSWRVNGLQGQIKKTAVLVVPVVCSNIAINILIARYMHRLVRCSLFPIFSKLSSCLQHLPYQ